MAEVVDSIIAELIARDNGYIETFDRATAAHGRFKASVDKLKVQSFDLGAEGQKYKAGAETIAQAEEQTTQRVGRARKARVETAIASDKAILASAKETADKQVAEAERAARLSAVAQRAVDRAAAGVPRGTGANFGATVPAGGSHVPASVVAAPVVEEVAAEKEINHILADQATLQAGLTAARGKDRDIIRDQLTELRLINTLKRAGLSDEEAAIRAETTLATIEAERAKTAEQQALVSAGNFAKGAGFGRLGGSTAAIAGIATAAGVAIGAETVEHAIEYGKALQNLSSQLGINTTALQVYQRAALQAGVSQEQFVNGIGQLQAYLGRAKEGDEQAGKTFAALGIDISKATSAGDLLPTLIDRISSIADPAQRAAVETRLFGEEGRKLDTVLSGGNAKINELAEALERTGAILSSSEIQELDQTARKYAVLKAELEVDLARIVAGNADAIRDLASAFAFLADHIGGAIQKAAEFAKASELGHPGIMKFSPVPLLAGAAGAVYGAITGTDKDPVAGGSGGLGTAAAGAVDRNALAKLFAPKGPRGKSATTLANEADQRTKKFNDTIGQLYDQQQQAISEETSDENARRDISRAQVLRDRDRAIADDRTQAQIDIRNGADKALTEARLAQVIQARKELAQAKLRDISVQDLVSALQRQAATDNATLDAKDDDLKAQEAIATTAAERRRIETKLLENAMQRERNDAQLVLDRRDAGDPSITDKDIALANQTIRTQPQRQAAAQTQVDQQNLGPLASYLKQLPTNADQLNEAFEGVAVDGLQKLTDGITDAITGAKSLGEAFHDVSKQIIADLVRIGIEKEIVEPLAGALFGGATGGGSFLSGLLGHHATGGNAVGGVPIVVGERGPEVFIPPVSGAISPNSALRPPGAGDGGGTGLVEHRITVVPTAMFDAHVDTRVVSGIVQAAPTIIQGAKSATFIAANRPGLPRSAG